MCFDVFRCVLISIDRFERGAKFLDLPLTPTLCTQTASLRQFKWWWLRWFPMLIQEPPECMGTMGPSPHHFWGRLVNPIWLGNVYVRGKSRNMPPFRTCQYYLRCIKPHQKCIKKHQNTSKRIRMYQTASKSRIKMYQNGWKRIIKYQNTTWARPHQTFCHSDAPVSDAYRPPPFHIWKWWPPLTTKAPTAWHQLALSNSVTTQALYCTVLYYYLQSFLFGAMVQFRPVVQFLHTLFEIGYIFHLS